LTPQDLTTIGWPDNLPLDGSISKVEDAVGRPLRVSLAARQPVLQRHLAAAGSGFGLAGKIPAGMRATAIRSNEIVGVAGFLFPGSHVDVIATYTTPSGTGGPQQVSETVLQDVEVLSTGTSVEPDPQGKPQTVSVVTLLLSPEDSQKLLLASAQGAIQFVLRSGVDQQRVDVPPTRLVQLWAHSTPVPEVTPAPTPVVKPRREAKVELPPVAVPAPVAEIPTPLEPLMLEVIQGTQRSIQKF
jgi:pilus assembly protein CpaB